MPHRSTRVLALSAPLAALALLAAVASPALASHRGRLWATVNICDTPSHPNMMGVRASMPGGRRRARQTMYMRFRAEYFDRDREQWFDVGGDGLSPWIRAGRARYRSRQAGYTFEFDPPRGGSFVLRGVVNFEWRERRRRRGRLRTVVVKRARENTRANHPTPRADPPGFSDGLCEIL
jgi:hypothetical protein